MERTGPPATGPRGHDAPGGPGGPGRGSGTGGGSGDGGPGDPGTWPSGPDESGENDGLGADEQALRRLLREAVKEVGPGEQSLERLRRAVPARRARKRQALVGAAAAVVLLGTAVPALIHVSNSRGAGHDRTAVAGHDQDVPGGTGHGKEADGGRQGAGQPSGSGHSKHDGAAHGSHGHGTGDAGSAGSPDPENTLAARSPGCVASALGNAQASVGPPDAEGKVYGSFRVSNVSGSDCTVDGAGTVATLAQGAADPARITVVDHTAGDPATGLPAPADQPAQLILAPGQSYQVEFAWVPSAACPSGGDASPDPTSSDTPTAAGGDTGASPQLYREDGDPADGSVAVSHTAEPGAPTAGTTIPNACAGTLYRTGLLPAS
ncbi:hypothetical protein [Streptomyces sulfonofaciens]|nr:hypothetical protein [Streptomyces sulfonofaciens]